MRSALLILALLGFAGVIIWTDQPIRMEARGPEIAAPASEDTLIDGVSFAATSASTTMIWTSGSIPSSATGSAMMTTCGGGPGAATMVYTQ